MSPSPIPTEPSLPRRAAAPAGGVCRRGALRRVVVLTCVLATVGGVGASRVGAEPPGRAGATLEAWEVEVEHETADQNAAFEAARPKKTMKKVVESYASREARAPSALNHYLLGRALYYNDDPVGAKTQMGLALEADPKFYYAHLRIALLLTDLKSYREAEMHLGTVLAVRPANGEALELATRIAVEQKDWGRALALLEGRLAKDPSDARIRTLLGRIHMQRKDWEAAVREWRTLKSRDPTRPDYRALLGSCLAQKGELDAAAAELESLVRELKGDPMIVEVLDSLRSIYVRKKDWDRVRSSIERMMPYLPEDRRKEATAFLEALRKGGPPPDVADRAAPRPPSWDEVFAATQDPDRVKRERALRDVYEAAGMGAIQQVPGHILRRVTSDVEPDPACRAWVIRLLGTLSTSVLPLVSLGLYDEDPSVRMLSSETLGEMAQPAGIVYLLPFVETEGLEVVEYQSVRAALSSLTGFADLPPGTTAVARPEDVAASREAWRRWRLSDASTQLKLAALKQLGEVREAAPERFLYDFVLDKTFDVMSVAYLAMRRAVARAPQDSVETKVFPRFPQFKDEEVVLPNMRAIQQRVQAWWAEWVAERRALLRAKAPSTPVPAPK